MPRRPFKNALCLAFMPDAYGFKHGYYWRCCHRRAGHEGPHRCMGRWEWDDGDHESRPVLADTGCSGDRATPTKE